MKNIFYILSIASLGLLASCEGDAVEEVTAKRELPKGMIEYDLSSHGMNLIVVIPDTLNQPVVVNQKDWGETAVSVGKYFQIQIAEGGDINLRKSDLAEDLLYKATYITEEATVLLYKQEIPDGGIKPAYHFYYITTIDGIQYEVEDVKTGDVFYNEKAADRMLQAAKLLLPAAKVS
jgi:hypothetical protein